MKKIASVLVLALLALLSVGCATSSNVVVNPGSAQKIHSAYVVLNEGKSSDMDAHIQRELMSHNIQVTAGPEMRQPSADVTVRYSDNWRWDVTMYLRSLDIQVYDSATGTLRASGSWKNSALHGYHGAAGVVKEVVDEIFRKLGTSQDATAHADH